MVMLSKSARLRFELDGQEVDAPIEWEDIKVNATFDNDSVQANISTDSFSFAPEEALKIKQWVASGQMYKGLPFKVQAYNNNSTYNVFDGFVNCRKGLQILNDGTVNANIQIAEGLNTLNDRLEGLTMSYLYRNGHITDADFTTVEYVVEAQKNVQDLIINSITAYILVTQLRAQIQTVAESISTVSGLIASPPGGSLGAIVYGIAVAIIQIAYAVFMVSAIINIGQDIFNRLNPIVRKHKVLKLKTAVEKICNYLGYNFVTNIALFENLFYLPSNNVTDDVNFLTGLIDFPKGTKTGIPNAGDYGYLAIEVFDLCMKMFKAKIQLKDGNLRMFNELDPYWFGTTTYVMPDVLQDSKEYNADDMVFSKLLRFDTDEIADEWTLINFKGTNYEIITDDPTVTNDNARYISGHETVDFRVCLGNRKDKLNAVENSLSKLAGIVDDTVNFFGGSSNLQGRISNKVGVLKVGTNNTTKPKILYLNSNGRIPLNHRDLFSAKTLYNGYINAGSFVLNNYFGQKAIYKVNELPFGFKDFLKTIENSNFATSNGTGKFNYCNTLLSGGSAEVEYQVQETYASGLTETYIEAE